MKVVMIMRSQSGVPGAAGVPGGQIGMVQLARALVRLNVDVELFVGGPRMAYLSGLDDVPVTYLRWPLRLDKIIKASPEILRTTGANLRRRRWLDTVSSLPGIATADVIHVQGLQDAETMLTRFSGPLVVTHWGRTGRWQPGRSSQHEDRSLPYRIQRIRDNVKLVALGQAQAETLAAAGMPPADVIAPGIDLQHFTPGDRAQARHRLGLPADGTTVLYVGRLAADKNVQTLLKAFARLDRQPGRTRLLVIGDGPLRPQLQRLSVELQIDSSTTFLAGVAHQDLPWYYRGCDVTVVPSDFLETYCMVALEAIACGCPLIVTDHVPEILRRFPDVTSVAAHDIDALSHQLVTAVSGGIQPADNTHMSDHDWSGVARRYFDLYQNSLRRKTL